MLHPLLTDRNKVTIDNKENLMLIALWIINALLTLALLGAGG